LIPGPVYIFAAIFLTSFCGVLEAAISLQNKNVVFFARCFLFAFLHIIEGQNDNVIFSKIQSFRNINSKFNN